MRGEWTKEVEEEFEEIVCVLQMKERIVYIGIEKKRFFQNK